MKVGDEVMILGKRTTLVTKLTSIEGGWVVDPTIAAIRQRAASAAHGKPAL